MFGVPLGNAGHRLEHRAKSVTQKVTKYRTALRYYLRVAVKANRLLRLTPSAAKLAGVFHAPRTAQAAMRHSRIDMTMNIYTDPRLLDTHGALDTLPSLHPDPPPSPERTAMQATGTDNHNAASSPRRVESAGATGKSFVAPDVATTADKRGQSVSFAVISSDVADERASRRVTHENPSEKNKKALSAVFADKAFEVEDNGVEPMTSCMPST